MTWKKLPLKDSQLFYDKFFKKKKKDSSIEILILLKIDLD